MISAERASASAPVDACKRAVVSEVLDGVRIEEVYAERGMDTF